MCRLKYIHSAVGNYWKALKKTIPRSQVSFLEKQSVNEQMWFSTPKPVALPKDDFMISNPLCALQCSALHL